MIQYIGLGAAIAFIIVAFVVIVKHLNWKRKNDN